MITAVNIEGADESITSPGDNIQAKLLIQGKATSEKIGELFSIFELILTDARLDSKSKVIEMLKESKSRLESRVQGAGHSMVNTRMKSRYRPAAYVDEITGGISYLDTLKVLIEQAENDWPSLLERLTRLRDTLLKPSTCRNGMVLDITGDKSVLAAIQPQVENFLGELPGNKSPAKAFDPYRDVHPWVDAVKDEMAKNTPVKDEGFVVPTQVSYVGKCGLLYETGERIPGSAAVVSRFLRTGYLWDYVRVIGGAYGGFCTFSPFSGFFSFLSYRDPNLDKTLDVYDAAADALLAAADAMETDRDALETAIIGAIGDMDGSLSPDQKGFTSFQRWLINESPEYRQRFRDEILNTTPNDFREFALRLKKMKDVSVAVVSAKSKFEEAAKAGKTMELTQIL
jgi:Zn-dependent M16 (insulinase) family peptidase